MTEYTTHTEAETEAVGRTLGRTLSAGSAVLLHGPLGAGKTAFARGLADGAQQGEQNPQERHYLRQREAASNHSTLAT